MGTKVIGAMDSGTIRFEGLNKKSWAKLGINASVANTSITLAESVGWQVGDEILITSSRENWNEAEKRTITAKSADNKTFSFGSGLAYPHAGIINNYTRNTDGKTWNSDIRAEVGLLSHNIKIQGDASSVTNGFGGHIMIHQNGKAFVSNVELYRMGQKATNGRYPIHWHMMAASGNTQFIKNSSIHQSFNRAVTIHGTHGITVENNFIYDHIGHGVFLENGSEINNIITKNVVLHTKKPAQGEQLTPSDNSHDEFQNRSPASFWITNPNNSFTFNVAAGTEGAGYWYALAQDFMFESKNDPRFANQTKPYKEAFGGFSGNTAHSCRTGLDIFDRLDANHALITNAGWEEPNLKYFTNNNFYSNLVGVYGGIGDGRYSSGKVIFSNSVFVENRFSLFHANYSITEESVFVANSGQNLINGERNLYEVYDGAATVRNSHLIGWDATNANMFANAGAAQKHTNHIFENITFNHTGPPRISYPNFNIGQIRNYNFDANQPTVWGAVFRDKTGSITGNTDYSIISNHPMLMVGDEQTFNNWDNMHFTPRNYVHTLLHMHYNSRPPNISITRSKPNVPDVAFYDIFSEPFLYHQMSLIVNDGFEYTYQFESLPLTKIVEQRVMDASVGDNYVARYKGFGKLGGLTVTSPSGGTLVNYNAINSLRNGTSAGYFIEPNGDLYLKTVAFQPDQIYQIRWTSDFTLPPLDTDGDGYTDSREVGAYRNPNDTKDLFFDFTTTTDDWSVTGVGSSSTNNAWILQANGSIPQILRSGLQFAGAEIPQIDIRLQTPNNGNLTLQWTTEEEPTFSADKAITTSSTQQIVSFTTQNHSKWNGQKITAIKITLPAGLGEIKVYAIGVFGNIDTDGDGLIGSEEADVCRNDLDVTDFSIDFDKDYESTATFGVSAIANFSVNNGIVSGTSLGDAHFYQNSKYNFQGSSLPQLILKIKANAASTVQIFWANEDGGFSESRNINKAYAGNNEWQYVVFDFSTNPNWMGKTIKQLRIDPVTSYGTYFEIDWLRGPADVNCQCTDISEATIITKEGNWTYYGLQRSGIPIFAIEHTPTGGNTLPFTAKITINQKCIGTKEIYAVKNTIIKEATLIGNTFWNIVLTDGSTNGFVNIRFFPDSDANAELDSESNTFFTTSGAAYQSSALFFKTNNKLQLPNDIRADGKGLNYSFTPLIQSASGTFNSKNYIQFNQVTNINNSGGGLLKRVTNLNENAYLTQEGLQKIKGSLRYNNNLHRFEGHNGTEWVPLH